MCIPHVVGLTAEPKVIGANAMSDIAMVIDLQTVWNWSDTQLPSNSMCQLHSTIHTEFSLEHAITAIHPVGRP
jgi:hypothetical protein